MPLLSLYSKNEHDWRKATIDQIKILFEKEAYLPATTCQGENIPIRIKQQTLPMHCAVEANASLEIIRFLHEIDPNAVKTKRYDGCLPIHIAARRCRNHLIPFLLYIFPESGEVASSIAFKFKDYQEVDMGNYGSPIQGHTCLKIAEECIIGDRVRIDTGYEGIKSGIIAKILPHSEITRMERKIRKTKAEDAYSKDLISLEAKEFYNTFKSGDVEKDDEERELKLISFLTNRVRPIRKARKAILEEAKLKQLEEKNIFAFFSQDEEVISGEHLENLGDREIGIMILSSIEYFEYLKHIHRDILSKLEIEVKYDGENPSSQILRKRLKKNRKEYKSEWDKKYSEIADLSEMNKILFDNIAKILSGKVSEILMQRKLSPLPSRTNVKELDMYPDLDLALSKADEEHLVNFLLTQYVRSEVLMVIKIYGGYNEE